MKLLLTDYYDMFLQRLITEAQWCSTEEQLSEGLKDLVY